MVGCRAHVKGFSGKTFEFGEQVLAKPKRTSKAIRRSRNLLEARFNDAAWFGFNARSNEHIVVLKDGGPALKARTVKPKSASERWEL